jgi:hypothetical protein
MITQFSATPLKAASEDRMNDFSMPMAPPPPSGSHSFMPVARVSQLSAAIWIVLLVSAVIGLAETLFAMLRSLVAISLVDDFTYDTADTAILLDDISSAFVGLNVFVAIAIFVLLVIFSHKFSKKVLASGYKLTLPLGMSIGAWFIPLANMVLCFIIFLDFIRVSTTTMKRNLLLLNLWWWMWVAGVVLSAVFNSSYDDADTWDGATAIFSVLSTISSLVAVVGLICGVLFFRELRKVEMNLLPAVPK